MKINDSRCGRGWKAHPSRGWKSLEIDNTRLRLWPEYHEDIRNVSSWNAMLKCLIQIYYLILCKRHKAVSPLRSVSLSSFPFSAFGLHTLCNVKMTPSRWRKLATLIIKIWVHIFYRNVKKKVIYVWSAQRTHRVRSVWKNKQNRERYSENILMFHEMCILIQMFSKF